MPRAKYKRTSNGYFQTRVWDGTYSEDGKKHYKTLRSNKSSRDLERVVEEFKARVEQRRYVKKSDVLFVGYARAWKSIYKNQREANTRDMYERIIEKHFCALESVKLLDVERIHLQLLLNNASGKLRTQQQIMLTFKQVLKSAVADHLFPANVAEDIFAHTPSIKYVAPEKRPLTAWEREAIFEADFNEQDRVFIYLLYGCGLRRGEALALTVFDFHGQQLTVSKSHEFTSNTPRQKSTKSANGCRTVPIPDKVYPAISDYVKKLISSGRVYLFTTRTGKPVTKSSYVRMWKRIVSRMQDVSDEPITGLTAHVFRHNYCTGLCYQIPTVSIRRIAQLLGDSERMVLDVYNHIMLEWEDAEKAVNDAIDFDTKMTQTAAVTRK